MSPDYSVDEPEITTESTADTVSPKPVHYPAPSNIPVLANQMDPVFNDTSTHLNAPEPTHASQALDEPAAAPTGSTDDTEIKGGQDAEQQDTANPPATDSTASIDPHSTNSINFQDPSLLALLSPSSQASNAHAPPHPTSEAGSAPTQADHVPTHDPTYNVYDASSSLSNGLQPSNQEDLGPAATQPSPGVNIQALLDSLNARASASKAHANQDDNAAAAPPAGSFDIVAAVPEQREDPFAFRTGDTTSSVPSSAVNLPPRPPPIETTAASQTYQYGAIGNPYQSNGQPQMNPSYPPPPGTSYQLSGSLPPPPLTGGAPGTSPTTHGLPPPPSSSFMQNTSSAQNSPTTPGYRPRDVPNRQDNDSKGEEDLPWGPEVQKKYDEFLHEERNWVMEGQWDRFPLNSRLFIGNLPTEKVTKRDLFHVFHKYGKLAQISIKQAYGFIQFLDAEACLHALQAEQGMPVRGRKLHLEISKPQKNTKKGSNDHEHRGGRNRRSRSPGTTAGRQGSDRYRGGQSGRGQGSGVSRNQDNYRPGRSPSPRGYRDSRGGPDRYDGRRRSRSRSPYGRSRHRSRSPRRDLDDDLPLPRRDPRDVPDLQIIVIDNLDRAFNEYVENSFRMRGIRVNILRLSPQLSEPAVVRRQIVEGVLAVMKLNRTTQATQKFAIQVFDRSAGVENVKFEEYNNLDLNVCVNLVLNKKQLQQLQPPRGQVPFNDPVAYAAAQFGLPAAAARPQQQNPIANMDSSTLSALLGRLQSPQNQQPPMQHQPPMPQQPPATADLSRLLSGITPQQNAPYHPPQQLPMPPFSGAASLASLLGGPRPPPQQMQQQQPQPPQSAQPVPDMASILAQLGKYKQ